MATAISTMGVSPFHHFGDKADDGGGGLIYVQLSKQVADIVCCASLFPCNESKKPGIKKNTSVFSICAAILTP